MAMTTILYRAFNPLLRPRRTKLEMPGWAGENQPRQDGSHEQPWHCLPFTEAARSTIELPFPHEDDVVVSVRDGEIRFEGEFGDEDSPDERRPPFRSFGAEYYTYQLGLDIKAPEGFAIRVEAHPRFFTDATGRVPIAVPAVIRPWWPMINFLVFKTPRRGEEHVFRPDEGMAALTLIRPDDPVEVIPMNEEEAAERELMSRRLHASRDTLGVDSRWTSDTETVFDGTYRRLYGAARGKRD